ncbi:hypothetical protein L207DRAFT_587652 [Hyaloscypha variabilis F]|uniref:Uncharacterized protein n=1 Tax=Hyaloscypha variabilis (strain UAMH 11265 / GT02V1 / F) TaxID=1149755 RepID=A0A2J6RA21_HYAVF|nr:hypothetical protein L207DRAFT_587652 [Hyaloscypha variabilis F]
MKALSLLSVWTLIEAANANSCNADNCLRAVIGSAFPTRDGAADCSSYFKATVTPAVISTITNTETVTTSTTTDLAPSVPTYGFNASSCIGAKATTTTLPSKTTTTSTITKTKTVSYDLPIFTAYQWQDQECSQVLDPSPILFELGQCVNIPYALGISFDSFSPGSCETTAPECYISYNVAFGCPDGGGSPPFPLEGCADIANGIIGYFAGELVCPNCTP